MHKSAGAAIALALTASVAFAQIPDGDRAWANRAAGAAAGHARAEPINTAIAAYQLAVTQHPNNIEARWKLLRAYRFKGAYVASTNAEKKDVYSQAKKAGTDAIA